MKNIAFVGLQNGDEGKGRHITTLMELISGEYDQRVADAIRNAPERDARDFTYAPADDIFCAQPGIDFAVAGYQPADGFAPPALGLNLPRGLVYRWQGGRNAGHTIYRKKPNGLFEKFGLHQVPCGILTPNTYNFMGTGVFLDPVALCKELDELEARGVEITPENFGISSKAHVTLDHHLRDDQKCFDQAEHSSTGSGIKQTARDKAYRTGLRLIEFLDEALTKEVLLGHGVFDHNDYSKIRERLTPFIAEEAAVFNQEYDFIVGEGAQGALLDVDYGQYPGTTSSNTATNPHRPDIMVGVYKLYQSSVGIKHRPFVAEMSKELQEQLIEPWREFGVTTGKPRHIGWFDTVAGKYTRDISRPNMIVANCLDRLEILAELGESVKLVTAYELNGRVYTSWDVLFDKRGVLAHAKPITEEFESWSKSVEDDGKTLTPPAEAYISRIEELLGQRFMLLGIGPHAGDYVVRDEAALQKMIGK